MGVVAPVCADVWSRVAKRLRRRGLFLLGLLLLAGAVGVWQLRSGGILINRRLLDSRSVLHDKTG